MRIEVTKILWRFASLLVLRTVRNKNRELFSQEMRCFFAVMA